MSDTSLSKRQQLSADLANARQMLEQVLNQVMDAIIRLTDAERGYLMLFDEDGELVIMAARNLDRETLDEADFAISRSVIRTVAETGEQVVTTNATEDPRFAGQASVVAHNLRAIDRKST